MRKYLYKRMWMLLLVPVSFLILYIAEKNSWIAEHIFARGIYYYLSQLISTVTGIFPFSIAEIFVLCSPILVILVIVLFLRHIAMSEGRHKTVIYKAVLNVLCVISAAFFIYVITDSVNYYRYPFSYYAGFEVEKSTVDELYAVGEDIVMRANEIREELVNEDDEGVFKLTGSMGEVSEMAREAYKTLGKEYPVLKGHYGKNKLFLTSKYISYSKMVGLFVPFTMEANNNVDVVQYNIPSDMCHELAHLHGFIKEDEANYIAYLACTNSGNMEFEYSGLVQAYICIENALYDADLKKCEELTGKLSDKVRRDVNANSIYWKKIEDTKTGKNVSSAAESINDEYLKANGQEEGVKSYGLMVDLLISQYRSEGFLKD
ncbi:MAG: DUF3810 domain-containing protein [Lachnospiraceae bacterium]|nr:DUF3810 domain-containing protein [Lachnospiraceae bacterium]